MPDINKDIGSEVLTFRLSELTPSSATLSDQQDSNGFRGVTYRTMAQVKHFKFNPWGSYTIIGFLGDGYLAAYSRDVTAEMSAANVNVPILYDKSTTCNLMSNNQLSMILTDENTEREIAEARAKHWWQFWR